MTMPAAFSHLTKAPVLTGIRLIGGGLFVYAGIIKVIDPQHFRAAIASFQIVSEAYLSPIALLLPPLEILAGGAWILNRVSRSAAVILLALCVVFLGALGLALSRGVPADCGCFGSLGASGMTSLWTALIRDVLLACAIARWLRVDVTLSQRESLVSNG